MAERAETARQGGADVTGAYDANLHSESFDMDHVARRRHKKELGSMWERAPNLGR